MKDFILSRTALNHRDLCRQINWSASSFSQWLKGERGIPDDKLDQLKTVLKDYGYNDNTTDQIS